MRSLRTYRLVGVVMVSSSGSRLVTSPIHGRTGCDSLACMQSKLKTHRPTLLRDDWAGLRLKRGEGNQLDPGTLCQATAPRRKMHGHGEMWSLQDAAVWDGHSVGTGWALCPNGDLCPKRRGGHRAARNVDVRAAKANRPVHAPADGTPWGHHARATSAATPPPSRNTSIATEAVPTPSLSAP
jgi:hypothetical protein